VVKAADNRNLHDYPSAFGDVGDPSAIFWPMPWCGHPSPRRW